MDTLARDTEALFGGFRSCSRAVDHVVKGKLGRATFIYIDHFIAQVKPGHLKAFCCSVYSRLTYPYARAVYP